MMREILQTHIGEAVYDPIECSSMSKTISHEIKMKVKEMDFERFKVRKMFDDVSNIASPSQCLKGHLSW